ncbi:tryptophan synthase alpha chain [Pelolinea submarina]|nr:tryptophan synthase alpha chain [Pelolinea submarina]
MFDKLHKNNEGVLIPLAPGDKAPFSISNEIIDMFYEAGADTIEIAVPTRYPWMEGNNMQIHQLEAIEQSVKGSDSFDLMKFTRNKYPDWPLLTINFMGPVFRYGQANYVQGCADASMDAVDIPDYAYVSQNDSLGFVSSLLSKNVYFIVDIATKLAMAEEGTREYALLCELIKKSKGFLFMIAQPGGVSGTKSTLPVDELKPAVDRVKELEEKFKVNTPIVVVCGISSPEQVRQSIREVGADGVMLGSAISKRLQAGETIEKIEPFTRELKEATKG